MKINNFIKKNINKFFFLLKKIDLKKLALILDEIKLIKKNNKKILIFGNGGSSAIASHFAVDLTKNAGVRCLPISDVDLITCFANDFGFENWIKNAIKYYYNAGDLVILISSSGCSKNMLNAADYCNKNMIRLITLTGFDKKNLLSKKGNINFWVNSKKYNFVELAHLTSLLSIVDNFIEN